MVSKFFVEFSNGSKVTFFLLKCKRECNYFKTHSLFVNFMFVLDSWRAGTLHCLHTILSRLYESFQPLFLFLLLCARLFAGTV